MIVLICAFIFAQIMLVTFPDNQVQALMEVVGRWTWAALYIIWAWLFCVGLGLSYFLNIGVVWLWQ